MDRRDSNLAQTNKRFINETDLGGAEDHGVADLSDLPLFGGFASSPSKIEIASKAQKSISRNTVDSSISPPSPKTLRKSVKAPESSALKSSPPTQSVSQINSGNRSLDMEPVLLSVTDLCKMLKVSRSTLIRMEKSGLVPGRLVLGGSVRYHLETIRNWLQDLAKLNS